MTAEADMMGAEMDISGDRDAEASERSERSFRISLFIYNKERERGGR